MSELDSGYIPPNVETEITSSVDDSISDLIKDEPRNKWEDHLRSKGVPLDTFHHFFSEEIIEGEVPDNQTGLMVETDNLRRKLAEQFSKSIKSGENWAILYGDADNLKAANTRHGREYGDMLIKYGAAVLTKVLSELDFPEEVIQVVTRQTNAADEQVGYLFNLTDEQIQQLNDVLIELDNTIEVDDPKFLFSQTFSLITSKSPEAQEYIASAQEYLKSNPNGTAYLEFNSIKQHLDDDVKLKKIAKDIKRIPVDRLAGSESEEDIRNILLEEIGDMRISTPLLEKIMQINEFETHWKYRNAFDTVDAYIVFARRAGISEEVISSLTSDYARVEFYQGLIPEDR
jgi:GGDEF domain-containing protein